MSTSESVARDFSRTEVAVRRSALPPTLKIVGHNDSFIAGHNDSFQFGQSPPTAEPAIAFGPFRLLPAQRLLLEAGKPVRLGSRALDILIALVERAGQVVGKEELMNRVWPNTFVEGGNLKVHVAALRKMLGDGQPGQRYVVNVHGRGYVFVAPVRRDVR
jgi:DNA-binding winged helix-turn-helix (wHTH) protein